MDEGEWAEQCLEERGRGRRRWRHDKRVELMRDEETKRRVKFYGVKPANSIGEAERAEVVPRSHASSQIQFGKTKVNRSHKLPETRKRSKTF